MQFDSFIGNEMTECYPAVNISIANRFRHAEFAVAILAFNDFVDLVDVWISAFAQVFSGDRQIAVALMLGNFVAKDHPAITLFVRFDKIHRIF